MSLSFEKISNDGMKIVASPRCLLSSQWWRSKINMVH